MKHFPLPLVSATLFGAPVLAMLFAGNNGPLGDSALAATKPTATPTPKPKPTATPTPKPTATPVPSPTPTLAPTPTPTINTVGFNLNLAEGSGWYYGYSDFIAPCRATYAGGNLKLYGALSTPPGPSGIDRDTTIVLHNVKDLKVGDTFLTGDFDAFFWVRHWYPMPKGSDYGGARGAGGTTATLWDWGNRGGTTGQITVEGISGTTAFFRVTNLSVIDSPNYPSSTPLVFNGTIQADLPIS